MRKGLIYAFVSCLLVLALPVAADTDKKMLGDVSDGSRAVPVHLIPLLDEEGEKIAPDDDPLLPFSPRRTCSGAQCHNVETISKGWHFNAADPGVSPGRPGQPWILVDAAIGTQVPLSYRPWPGTFRPEQLGLTAWKFVQRFGRQMPGGGVGELLEESDNPDEVLRAYVSGKLEINCLSCHNAHPGQDQAEYADQIARQNFRWAAAAACEFASVTGSAGDMPDTYDPFMPEPPEDPKLLPPTVRYRENIFDHKNRVLFDIVGKVPDERCYFCHSNASVDKNSSEKWATDEDVHLAAGLTCVDCHRNGLDHNITHGYEGEDAASKNLLAATTTCEGCHMEGRLGAPVPKHRGLPPVHFDKLTCTACHSGPWPVQKTRRTKTARAHALGTHNVNKSDDVLPHIMFPVYAEQSDGKIGPNKLFWPAFWGNLKDENVKPIQLEILRPITDKILTNDRTSRSGDWQTFTTEQMTKVLASLSKKSIEGKPVYICGGKLYHLDDAGQLLEEHHPAAGPYLWPIAHNVRPAAQSLGARRCEDCHSTDSGFFFGLVPIDSPLESARAAAKEMVEFQGLKRELTWFFAFSFVFRPWMKIVSLGSCAVLGIVLLLFGLKALSCVVKVLTG